jgi:predicted RNA-binding Zn-ribbon protein involved in translation (DUF1610 family)
VSKFADSIELTLPCPQCGKEVKEKLGRLNRDKAFTCPKCGRVKVTGDGLQKISAALKDLDKALAKMTTKIKFKL